ncbi:BRCA1-A complex subunit RAP80 isoform 2-T2 [Ctenodactylus gundi]
MPRRKKKVKETSELQNSNSEKDTEITSSVTVKRKRRVEDAFIVISDSDGEEPKEENGLQKMKTKQSNRAECLAERKIAQMTEEEQFALAVKMSEQEARDVNSQEEEEEELLRKAIAESLNTCRPSDASATRSRPLATGPSSPTKRKPQSHQEKTTDSGTTEGIWQLVPPSLFKGSHVSQGNEAEEREEPWDHTENNEEEPVSGSSGSWDQSSQPISENDSIKYFDRCTGHLAEHTQCGKPQSSQRLFVEETSEEGNSIPASESIATLTSERSLVHKPESSAEEITVCPETQLSSPEGLDLERKDFPGLRETLDEVKIIVKDKEVGNQEGAEKETTISTFSSGTQVSCPLCDQSFPPTKIERHAMYCNGLIEQYTVLTRRQMQAQNKNDSGTAAQTYLDTDNIKKCSFCKSLLSYEDYQCHIDSCLQLARGDQRNGPQGSGRACPTLKGKCLRNSKGKGHSEGGPHSFLEQSEHKTIDAEIKTNSSETGTFRLPSEEDAGCSRRMQSSLTQLNLDESPIKSFVSISEATDCLVDFKKQLNVRSGSRTRTKAGRGRRRKS